MADEYCGKCGTKIKEDFNFCTTCGNKVKNIEKAEKTLDLKEFIKNKGSERGSFFKRKNKKEEQQQPVKRKKFTFSSRSKVEDVTINIGIISDTNGQLTISRGSKLPVRVSKHFDSAQVLLAAVKKHSDHDQFFCPLESYVLLYPDQKQVISIPGSPELFTLEKYKKELAKPYSKIDLYLCLSSSFFYHDDKEIEILKNDSRKETESILSPSDIQPIETPCEDSLLDNLPMPDSEIGAIFDEMINSNTVSNDINQFKTVESKLLCPICNKKFPVSIIESHANECLARSQNHCIIVYDSPDECETDKIEHTEPVAKNNFASEEEITNQITSALKSLSIDKNKTHQIHVRRGQCFIDFTSFFKKKWNKPGCFYKITFIGEAGIDTGGLSREFYSGISYNISY